ncbi:SDR family oxidoreductase [Candidatus Laterigemmans baculatus]|uniref:SDR family oxidoreductase n=1 Tax=Candidatus Laterigemmans baculatus TaxID=2770505 RepID=UPI0013DC2203|nr:SDR family NAD(P)-dependent oxidoreductase [Candidatus Laterigemmans baculatus]
MGLLEGKVVWVTGASSGIGRAAAKAMATEGAAVVCSARRLEELESLVEEIRTAGGRAAVAEADITDSEQLKAAVEVARREFGRLDSVFANAGINGTWAALEELDEEEFRKTIEVNLTGTFLTCKAALESLKESHGSILMNCSVNGTRIFSNRGATAYSSSKAGQLAMMQMMAVELGEHRIRVNAICPGAIATEINEKTEKEAIDEAGPEVRFPEGHIPLTGGKPATAKQVAELVVFLTSDRASHISGTPVWIDGAQSLLQG